MGLLPNEPRLLHPEQEAALTEHFLLPCRREIEQLFLTLRRQCDPSLSAHKPLKLGKLYPLGQCLEISQAVVTYLARLDPSTLNGGAAKAYKALQAFLAQGGSFRQVWGDLRGEYFQNALLLGTLYVDVANDTVNPAKPPIEILPFTEAQFYPIADYAHFTRVASRYWQAALYSNHLFPGLAPFFPLLGYTATGGLQLHSLSDYMMALTCRQGFAPSQAVLEASPIEPALFDTFNAHCQVITAGAAMNTAEQGRQQAIAACEARRGAADHTNPAMRERAIRVALIINQQLAVLGPVE